MYFLVSRKCSIFGVHCEGLPRQINYLTDEESDCGKGANIVISQLHHFFCHHSLGEMEVFLHADNCAGQNKNNMMIQYLSWRVMTRLHTKITLSFLVVGHTKFSPDWCFGLLKQKYRKTKVGSLRSLAAVVDSSAECNYSQLVTSEDGKLLVPIYDWTSYFSSHFRRLQGITQYHHFHFNANQPGEVIIKERFDTAETTVRLLKHDWVPNSEELPEVITPKGLSLDRKWYLYQNIRQFCPDEDKDYTCPRPSREKPTSRSGTPNPAVVLNDIDTPASPDRMVPAPKRLCGKCRLPGHNARKCINK